ncbi:Lrp/AsnC family transcriptional regulator [Candidatus Nitrosocosmicus hydrocola]|uniref:Lrp/AsnC family transcriptional regulator n=1 Tax=Candidatus Nitrosocosmicus hydrocola TaxID=1826872 RepID=UPI0011E58952|nr:Lrp/AsnC ligand binding domain-containing protein [Candidatus Nitrosocosmicus hydrocola]
MLGGKNNKQTSKLLSIPLSTVQRRVRHLFAASIITSRIELNYEKLGYKTGLLHIYLENGGIDRMAKRIDELEGVTFVEIHIGNSDILAHVVYKDGKKLLSLVSEIKNFDGVERIVWSERVYQSPHKNLEVKMDL